MTESSMTLAEYLRKITVDLEGDFLREGIRLLAQMRMEGEISEQIGAARYQRTSERKTPRNGYRARPWDTQVGSIELAIPPGARRELFPEPHRAMPMGREGVAGGRAAGVRRRLAGGLFTRTRPPHFSLATILFRLDRADPSPAIGPPMGRASSFPWSEQMLTMRDFRDAQDLEAMVALLLRVRPPERISDWPGVVDLQEVMQRPAVTVHTRLWSEGDKLAAWAFVDEWTNLHFLGEPPVDRWAEQMIAWAAELARERRRSDEGITLDANASESDAERIDLLRRYGFEEQDEHTVHYFRPLDEPIEAPVLPERFTIRPLASDEVEAAAALHCAAFGTEYMTVENRRAMMWGEAYDPEGDLVAVAPDGRLAAYTMASISPTENAISGRQDGFTDPVATHPDFRRLGLAKALLLTGCARLQARGATRVRLGTSSRNVGMRAAAESAGYRVESKVLWFSLNN